MKIEMKQVDVLIELQTATASYRTGRITSALMISTLHSILDNTQRSANYSNCQSNTGLRYEI
jgi:hypothetical protein